MRIGRPQDPGQHGTSRRFFLGGIGYRDFQGLRVGWIWGLEQGIARGRRGFLFTPRSEKAYEVRQESTGLRLRPRAGTFLLQRSILGGSLWVRGGLGLARFHYRNGLVGSPLRRDSGGGSKV